jgi:hypothetical protein
MSTGGRVSVHFAAAGALLLVGATWDPRPVIATDEITRLPTRIELMRAVRRLTKRYTLAFVEVDDYARFRSEHGVEAGQRMLRLIAKRLRAPRTARRRTTAKGRRSRCCSPASPPSMRFRHLDAVRITVEDLTVDVSVGGPPPASRLVRAGTVERTVSVTISAGWRSAASDRGPEAGDRSGRARAGTRA